jgi:hypothetical protein
MELISTAQPATSGGGFVQWSVAVVDNPPDDWRAGIGRIEI